MIYIFDVDGTLCDLNSTELYEGAIEGLRRLRPDPEDLIFIATNQGGVGLRWWMENEGWGNPEAYPTQEDVEERLAVIKRKIEFITGKEVGVRVCFAYATKNDRQAPIPMNRENDPRWQHSWRKPFPGMILDIISEAGIPAGEQVLFVGDSEADRIAAKSADVEFVMAKKFLA